MQTILLRDYHEYTVASLDIRSIANYFSGPAIRIETDILVRSMGPVKESEMVCTIRINMLSSTLLFNRCHAIMADF